MRDTPRLRNMLLFSFILLKFIIQYHLFSDPYELHRDEFLHLDQANHLDWGYLSVPPLTSWISIIIATLGNSFFWIKFFPTLFGACTIAIVWKAVEELDGNLFALLLSASCVTFSVLFRLNTLYQPNSLDVLCWSACYYFLLRYIRHENPKWLYFFAISFAIGFLNKYNIIFLLAGLTPALLFAESRKIFGDKHLYMAAGLSLLLVLPNLLWQYTHGFPVFLHLRELASTQLVNVSSWSFIRSQLLFFPGTMLIVFFGLYALFANKELKHYRFLLWSFLLTMTIFLLLKAKDYYAIGLYPIYFAFGAVTVSRFFRQRPRFIIQALLVVLPLLLFAPMFQFAFPNKSPHYIVDNQNGYRLLGMLRWEDGNEHTLPQDFADMLGWKELARKVDSVYLLTDEPQQTLVLCDNYGQAGAINYYSTAGIRAVSFNADYVNWFDLSKPFKHLIRIKRQREEEQEMRMTAPLFQKSVKAGQVTNLYAREYGTVIFRFTDAKIDINERIRTELHAQPAFLNGSCSRLLPF